MSGSDTCPPKNIAAFEIHYFFIQITFFALEMYILTHICLSYGYQNYMYKVPDELEKSGDSNEMTNGIGPLVNR